MDKCVQMLDKELLRLGPDGPVEEKDIREEPRLGWRKSKKPCPGSRKHERRALVGTDWKSAKKKILVRD
ncbi:hypothetical protein TNCV_4301231 [Trichonephila clavipes]|uniref:Uncharacterized protein n=1 Tax=Trichonephila clavipes TaxID=2585209 RepID=A0A8X6RTT5_TRICX|nr:hypothetical protein TNCV_4301231 [Trichonephila clavipes]